MTEVKISTGCDSLDKLLQGGLNRSGITLIYGEAGTGKTTAAIQIATRTAKEGFKVLYVDSDRSFTQQRFQQITGDSNDVSELVLLFFPENFEEQQALVESIENFMTPAIGLVVVDSMSSLYRAAFSGTESVFRLNRALTRQLAYLSEFSMTRNVACLITSQVHARLTGTIAQTEPVARRALLHFSEAIIRVRSTPSSNLREFLIERSGGIDVAKRSCILSLSEKGFSDIQN